QLRRFNLRSAPPQAFEPELPDMLRRLALRLPEGFNPRTRELGLQWRAEAGIGPAADEAIVRRALQWVTDEFAYTMATPLPGRHAVDEFLFDQKAGFCEHYSSAFAVLLGATGIPARGVTGYAGGYRNRFGDYWIIRQMDAHAWVEAWLDGRGWVRVDPTAAVAPERIFDTLEDLPQAGFDVFGNMAAARDLGDWLRRGWNTAFLGFDAARQRQLLAPLGVRDLGGAERGHLFSARGGLALAGRLWRGTWRRAAHVPQIGATLAARLTRMPPGRCGAISTRPGRAGGRHWRIRHELPAQTCAGHRRSGPCRGAGGVRHAPQAAAGRV